MNNTKILIADENLSMRSSLRDELREQGFANVYEAQNGEEAIAMILNAEFLICYVKQNFGGAYQAMQIAKKNDKTVFNIAE